MVRGGDPKNVQVECGRESPGVAGVLQLGVVAILPPPPVARAPLSLLVCLCHVGLHHATGLHKPCIYFNLTCKDKTEAERSHVTFPGSHDDRVAEPGSQLQQSID